MRRALLGSSLTVVFLASLVAAFLHVFEWNWLRPVAAMAVGRALGREFAIDGDLVVELDYIARVRAERVRLANASWSKEPTMVQIEAVDFLIDLRELARGRVVLPEVNLRRPQLNLEAQGPAKRNWVFSQASPSDSGTPPVIGQLTIHEGTLNYRDGPARRSLRATLNTLAPAENGRRDGAVADEWRLRLEGSGSVERQSFTVGFEGGSILSLRDERKPYPLSFTLRAGATVFSARGTVTDPVQLSGIDARLDVQGRNLADIFPFTGIPLPPTAPYQISGRLLKQRAVWTFERFKGRVGGSDLGGDLRYDASGERNQITADVVSQTLLFADLAGLIGAPPGRDKPAERADRVLPDLPLNLGRLRAADLDIRLRASRIEARGLPLQNMDARFFLRDGRMVIDPLKFGVAAGTIGGRLVLDGRGDVPQVETHLTAQDVRLQQFFARSRFESLSEGRIGGHLQITGRGRSVAEVIASGEGRAAVTMTGGQLSLFLVEAAGLELSNLLLTRLGGDKSVELRCAVGDFRVQQGVLRSDTLVIDTTTSNITGAGTVDFRREDLDLRFLARPKKPSAVGTRSPIAVTGPLKGPKVALDPSGLVARGAAATVLGIFFTPLAAMIPFVETGTGRDSDCAALTQRAQDRATP